MHVSGHGRGLSARNMHLAGFQGMFYGPQAGSGQDEQETLPDYETLPGVLLAGRQAGLRKRRYPLREHLQNASKELRVCGNSLVDLCPPFTLVACYI